MKNKIPLSLPKLKAKADRLFQLKRRIEESDENGFCYCISCGVRKHYKEMNGGHFIPKGNTGRLAVRYEKNNVWPQCVRCNHHLSGNVIEYEANLIKVIGLEEVQRLKKIRNEPVIFARSLFEKVISECATKRRMA